MRYTAKMLFAILFIVAFLLGLAVYRLCFSWVTAVSIPVALFIVTTLLDHQAREAWAFTLVFGIPLVFFAALLGAYVVQIRQPDNEVDSAVANRAAEHDSKHEEY